MLWSQKYPNIQISKNIHKLEGGKDIFFQLFLSKILKFYLKFNDNFHEDSFEVYYVSVSQKLVILSF